MFASKQDFFEKFEDFKNTNKTPKVKIEKPSFFKKIFGSSKKTKGYTHTTLYPGIETNNWEIASFLSFRGGIQNHFAKVLEINLGSLLVEHLREPTGTPQEVLERTMEILEDFASLREMGIVFTHGKLFKEKILENTNGELKLIDLFNFKYKIICQNGEVVTNTDRDSISFQHLDILAVILGVSTNNQDLVVAWRDLGIRTRSENYTFRGYCSYAMALW